jgi:hypothetical protein
MPRIMLQLVGGGDSAGVCCLWFAGACAGVLASWVHVPASFVNLHLALHRSVSSLYGLAAGRQDRLLCGM